jgi:hypothetical protein
MKPNNSENSANLAMWYRDVPIKQDELKTYEGCVTKECWRYLIGKLCSAQKANRGNDELIKDVYENISKDLGYVYPSLKRLVHYANAIDRIYSILPEIANDILNGYTRLSLTDTIIVAKMDFHAIYRIVERLSNEKTPAKNIIEEEKAALKKPERRGRPKKTVIETPHVSVKDMPAYNPDAQINGLSYTVQSWTCMIERAFADPCLNEVSHDARNRLLKEFSRLISSAKAAEKKLMEESNE